MKTVAIFGGGIAGLTAAYELSKKNYKVILIEKENKLGGQIYTVNVNGIPIEAGYHVIFPGQNYFAQLLEELGLKDNLKWTTGTTGFYEDKLYTVSSPTDLLKYRPLTIKERLKLVKLMIKIFKMKLPWDVLFKGSRSKLYDLISVGGELVDVTYLDSITAKEWLAQQGCLDLYERFFKKMLVGKFDTRADEVTALWLIQRMKLRNNRNFKGEVIGGIQGSCKIVLDELEKRIRKNNVEILLNSEVSKIDVKDNKIVSIKVGKRLINVDAVISTVPPIALAKLTKFPKEYLDKFDVPYQGTICLLIGTKERLTPHFWVNIMREDVVFKAIEEHTNIVSYAPYGMHLSYLALYPDYSNKLWEMSDKEIEELYLRGFEKLFPGRKILFKNVIKWKYSAVLGIKGATIKVQQLNCLTPIKNLFVGGVFNSYPERTIDFSIMRGKECAELVEAI